MTARGEVPRLNRRMVQEERVETPNSSGGYALSWREIGAQWVAVEAGAGRGSGSEALATGLVPLRLILRASPDGAEQRPKAGQRFREGGRVFAVLAVADADPDQRYLTCFAQEEVAR